MSMSMAMLSHSLRGAHTTACISRLSQSIRPSTRTIAAPAAAHRRLITTSMPQLAKSPHPANTRLASRLAELYSVVTYTKINEFSAVKHRLDKHYAAVLAQANAAAATGDKVGELDTLVRGLKDLVISQTKVHPDVEHLEDVVKQLRASAPVARPATAEHLVGRLRREIEQGLRRTEYALLYGKVLEEHARHQDRVGDQEHWGAGAQAKPAAAAASVAEVSANYAAQRKATLQEFCGRVFTPPPAHEARDAAGFARYLREEAFHLDDPSHRKFLDKLCKANKRFGDDLVKSIIETKDVRSMIAALLQNNLLDEPRKAALREIKNNEVVHGELATILNMQLTNLAEWSWPKEGVKVDIRRGMNGKFRMHMDEDLVTAMFLQWIGIKFSIQFKSMFKQIHESVLWSSDADRKEATRRGLPVQERLQSVACATVAENRQKFADSTFLAQLPSEMQDVEDGSHAYEDPDPEEVVGKEKAVAEAIKRKQDLVHLIGADAWLHRVTAKPDSEPFTVVRTDFEWFGPSLPHGHLLALLDFFGLPKIWLDFFQRFLTVPLRVPILDAPGQYVGQPQIRLVGCPIDHAISELLGESLLFVLDHAVARVGSVTWVRLHDDIWMWGSDAEAVKRAWGECEKFAKIAGLRFNSEKSGSVALLPAGGGTRGAAANCDGFPAGPITWGMLKLDATSGKWIIDSKMLDAHVTELRARLDAAPTVLTWVNSYNKYTRFIVRNCGSITQRDHAEQLITALAQFHQRVFPRTEGSPVRELATLLDRFDVGSTAATTKDIQDAFVHWPLSHGGLELWNPIIEPQATILRMDDDVKSDNGKDQSSDEYIGDLLDQEVSLYRAAKREHESVQAALLLKRKLAIGDLVDLVEADQYLGSRENKNVDSDAFIAQAKAKGIIVPDFTGQDEWIRSRRETKMAHWGLWHLWVRTVKEPKQMQNMATSLDGRLESLSVDGQRLHSRSPYWSWVVGMYGEAVVDQLGSLTLIPADVVPRSMVQAVKREKLVQDL